MGVDVGKVRFKDAALDRWAQKVSIAIREVEAKAVSAQQSVQVIGVGGSAPGQSSGNVEQPVAVSNFTATGTYSNIVLRWDVPGYEGHSFTRVFRSATDNFSEATKIADVAFGIYSDAVGLARTYYYWARHVNANGDVGPLTDVNGVSASTAFDLDDLFDRLNGKIKQDYLDSYLSNSIDLVAQLEQAQGVLDDAVDDLNAQSLLLLLRTQGLTARTQTIERLQLESYEQLMTQFLQNEDEFQQEGEYIALTKSLSDVINHPETGLPQTYARLIAEEDARANSDEALATRIDGIDALVLNPVSGLPATRAYVLSEIYTKAETDSAIATESSAIKATVFSPDGQSLQSAFIGMVDNAIVGDGQALSTRFTALDALVNDPVTGLTATRSTIQNDYATTADANQAAASAADAIAAKIFAPDGVTLNQAFISKVDSAVVNDGSAVNTSIALLDAQINDEATGLPATRALLTTEYRTEALTDQAITETVDALSAKIFDGAGNALVSAFVSQVDNAIVGNGEALSEQLTTLLAQVNDPATGLAATRSTLSNDYLTQTDTQTALSQLSNAILSEFFNPDSTTLSSAFVGKMDTALVNENGAIAQRLTTVESKATNNAANISTNYRTASSQDVATAQAISSLRAEFKTSQGQLTTAFVNQVDDALAVDGIAITSRVTQMQSQIDDAITADILQNYYTKTQADAAIAGGISQYKVTVNGTEASLQQWAQVAYDADNAFNAQWGVKSSVNGLEGGIGLLNNGNSVLFAIKTDKLALIDTQTNAVSNLFAVINNDPDIPDGVYIDSAFIKVAQIQDLVAGDVVADTVVAGASITSPQINGGVFSGGQFTAFAGGYLVDINPVSTLPIYYGNRALSKTTANASFAVDANGRTYTRDLTIRQNGQVIMDTNGFDGAFIDDLTVTTLKIGQNAVTVPHYVSSGQLRATSGYPLDYTYSQGEPGTVLFSFALELLRDGDVSAAYDSVNVYVYIYEGGVLKQTFSFPNLDGDSPGGAPGRKLWPLVGAVYVNSNSVRVRVRFISNISNQPYYVSVRGYIQSAKR